MQVDRTLKEISKKKLSRMFVLRQESNLCYRIVFVCCYQLRLRQGLSVESEANFSGLFIIVKGIWWQSIQINCTCSYKYDAIWTMIQFCRSKVMIRVHCELLWNKSNKLWVTEIFPYIITAINIFVSIGRRSA